MNKRKTNRGYNIIEFTDVYGEECSIQKSSLYEPHIWLGITEVKPMIMESKIKVGGTGWTQYEFEDDVLLNGRMHLDVKQCKDLIKILKRFVKTQDI
jgi:hypothetical protein